MNPDRLETLLRNKVENPSPRPGFETRIQALSRESVHKKKPWALWLAAPACLALFLGLALLKSDAPAEKTVETQSDPESPEKTDSLAFIEDTPVHRELRAVKSDAQKTVSFLSRSLPSLSLTKKTN